MKKFEILEHTADLKIRALGRNRQEVFENMMLGMQKALHPRVKKQEASTKIRIESEDLGSLLVDFLSEINYLNEVNKEIYKEARFYKFDDNKIEAELLGNKVSRFGEQIKGVTFHNLKVHQIEDGLWEAIVLFDV